MLIVNTCGFIGPARQESYEVLERTWRAKSARTAADCRRLPDRALPPAGGRERVHGIDGIMGTRRWMDIVEVVQELRSGNAAPDHPLPPARGRHRRQRRTRCAARGRSGRQRVSQDRRWLPPPLRFLRHPADQGHGGLPPDRKPSWRKPRPSGEMGVLEINLIAQDTTDYGHDLGMQGRPGPTARRTGGSRARNCPGYVFCMPTPGMSPTA